MKVVLHVAVLVVGIALVACHHEEKSEHCTLNGREIPCDQMPKGSPDANASRTRCTYLNSTAFDPQTEQECKDHVRAKGFPVYNWNGGSCYGCR